MRVAQGGNYGHGGVNGGREDGQARVDIARGGGQCAVRRGVVRHDTAGHSMARQDIIRQGTTR